MIRGIGGQRQETETKNLNREEKEVKGREQMGRMVVVREAVVERRKGDEGGKKGEDKVDKDAGKRRQKRGGFIKTEGGRTWKKESDKKCVKTEITNEKAKKIEGEKEE